MNAPSEALRRPPAGTSPGTGTRPQVPDINLTIDGHKLTVPAGTLIVEAAKTVGIEIHVLCYHHKIDPVDACSLLLSNFSPRHTRPHTACLTQTTEVYVLCIFR